VIAVAAGGYLETVIEGKTGTFFNKATVESLSKVLQKFDASQYRVEDLRKNAEKFSKENFKKKILALLPKS
ncbi:glycosyltransferase family 4 protein, partial [Candidatus Daviesbacteria bacterium]|nr:glycosyltransferase family 4 protein [Candidatus Daviesbacteria bacterium]